MTTRSDDKLSAAGIRGPRLHLFDISLACAAPCAVYRLCHPSMTGPIDRAEMLSQATGYGVSLRRRPCTEG